MRATGAAPSKGCKSGTVHKAGRRMEAFTRRWRRVIAIRRNRIDTV